MVQPAQSFENHAKMVTGYHKVAFSLLLAVLVWTVYRFVGDISGARVFDVLLVVGVMMVAFYARVFALGVQDRLIRLEERMRMERLFPDDLRSRVGELTTSQLIGLRFASDGELAELAQRVLDGELVDQKSIKKAVREWRPDHQRI